ncbi:MAG: hypothetical protein GY821_12130 [Gammaproteobacteria bacterium]|nr:hypothetical protein [Gammaproteobacteria bacterium]
MRNRLYFIVSIIIFIIAIAVIVVPMLRFQSQQQKLSAPVKVATAPIPKMEKAIVASKITTPELEKSVAAAAEPTAVKAKLLAAVKNKPLMQAQKAAKGWVVMVPVTSKQQETTVMTTFHAQGLSPFVISQQQKRVVYIGPVVSESDADKIAAQLPAFGLMQAEVQPFVPESFVAKISN